MGAAAAGVGGIAALGGVTSAVEGVNAGKSQAAYYGYLSSVAQSNAGIALAQGQAANQAIGAQEMDQQRRLNTTVRTTIGAQKAAMVNGVGGSSRSAGDIVSDTLNKGNIDEMALRYNAQMQSKAALLGAQGAAFNYQTQGAGYDISAGVAKSAAYGGAANSILGSFGSVANSWYMGSLYANRYGGVQ